MTKVKSPLTWRDRMALWGRVGGPPAEIEENVRKIRNAKRIVKELGKLKRQKREFFVGTRTDTDELDVEAMDKVLSKERWSDVKRDYANEIRELKEYMMRKKAANKRIRAFMRLKKVM